MKKVLNAITVLLVSTVVLCSCTNQGQSKTDTSRKDSSGYKKDESFEKLVTGRGGTDLNFYSKRSK